MVFFSKKYILSLLPSPHLVRTRGKGFTLVEAILVMVVLAFVISGAVYLAGTVIFTTHKNQNRITATVLTQECGELIRNIRDTAWKKNLSWDCAWDTFANGTKLAIESQPGESLCGANVFHIKLQPLGGNFGKLYLDNHRYTHTGSTETPFSRSLTLVDKTPDEALFECKTHWDNNQGIQESVSIELSLTHWK